MKIKLNTILADEHRRANPGDVIEVSTKEGRDLVKGGYAVEIASEKAPAAEPVEPEAAAVAPEGAASADAQQGTTTAA